MDALGRDHRLAMRDEHGVTGIGIEPLFAIGQRALLIEEAGRLRAVGLHEPRHA